MYHFLIIEDEESIAQRVQEFLADAGHTFVRVENATAAIDVYRKNPASFDCLICDFLLPEMSVYALVSRIRQFSQDTKFIVIAGFDDAKQDSSVDGFRVITKPVRENTLLSAITELLG